VAPRRLTSAKLDHERSEFATRSWCLESLMFIGPLRLNFKKVVVGNIRYTDHQYAHPPTGPVHHSGRDVDQSSLGHGLLSSVQKDDTVSLQNIVKLGGALVIVELRSVDVHGMRPRHRSQRRILATDESIAPAAGTSLTLRVPFVTNQEWAGGGLGRVERVHD